MNPYIKYSVYNPGGVNMYVKNPVNSDIHIGDRFGALTVVERTTADLYGNPRTNMICQCSCPDHTIRSVTKSNLIYGATLSCGCLKNHYPKVRKYRTADFTSGKTFGTWTVISVCKDPLYWTCKCKCGKILDVFAPELIAGYLLDCGCDKKYIRIIPGMRFGFLTAVSEAGRDQKGHELWLCKCDGGHERIARARFLVNGDISRCGAKTKRECPFCGLVHDLTGMRFGAWKVTGMVEKEKWQGDYKNGYWYCDCDCGKTLHNPVKGSHLLSGLSKSCGCRIKPKE